MAIQKVTDAYTIIQTAGDIYNGNEADQIYSLNPAFVSAGATITIIDQGGVNAIELVNGLTITESLVVANEIQLTLSNGAVVNIRGADTFSFNVGGNLAGGDAGTPKSFTEFVEQDLGVSVPGEGEGVAIGGEVIIGEENNDVAITGDTVGVEGVVENFTYDIDSSTGQVVSQLDGDYTLSNFTIGEDSLTFRDVIDGTTSTETFVNDVVTSGSEISNVTDIIFDANAEGNAYQLQLVGIIDESLATVDMSVINV